VYSSPIDIRKNLDIKRWQEIQDGLSQITGLTMATVDYKGRPVTKHSRCSKFCEVMRSDPKTARLCEKCDARGGFEAARINDIYIYRCHADIIDVAVPIIVGDKYMGAVMMGQVIIDEESPEEYGYIEKIYGLPSELTYVQDKMEDYYNELPVMTFEEVNNAARTIYSICNYIVEQAVEKYHLKNRQESNDEQAIEKDIINGLEQGDSIISPAIYYIENNLNENLTLKEAAKICYISPSYFSRIFTKEMGETYSSYVTNLKMDKAKELLLTTDKLIREISEDLGFSDQSYFIRQFKNYEGITPASYRKNVKTNIKSHKTIKKQERTSKNGKIIIK